MRRTPLLYGLFLIMATRVFSMPRKKTAVLKGRTGMVDGIASAWLSGNEDSEDDNEDNEEYAGDADEIDEARGVEEDPSSRLREAVQKQVQDEGAGTTDSTVKRYATFINPKNKWMTVSD